MGKRVWTREGKRGKYRKEGDRRVRGGTGWKEEEGKGVEDEGEGKGGGNIAPTVISKSRRL